MMTISVLRSGLTATLLKYLNHLYEVKIDPFIFLSMTVHKVTLAIRRETVRKLMQTSMHIHLEF